MRHIPHQQPALKDKLTPEQMQQRAAKTLVRAQLSTEHAKTRGIAVACYNVLSRGFFGRLKWLFFGR